MQAQGSDHPVSLSSDLTDVLLPLPVANPAGSPSIGQLTDEVYKLSLLGRGHGGEGWGGHLKDKPSTWPAYGVPLKGHEDISVIIIVLYPVSVGSERESRNF